MTGSSILPGFAGASRKNAMPSHVTFPSTITAIPARLGGICGKLCLGCPLTLAAELSLDFADHNTRTPLWSLHEPAANEDTTNNPAPLLRACRAHN